MQIAAAASRLYATRLIPSRRLTPTATCFRRSAATSGQSPFWTKPNTLDSPTFRATSFGSRWSAVLESECDCSDDEHRKTQPFDFMGH